MEGLPEWCDSYIGIPFKSHGRNRSGLDCYGLVQLVFYEQLTIALPSYTEVYTHIDGQEAKISLAIQKHAAAWERVTNPQMYDVAVFKIAGLPLHVGVVLKPGVMLHALKGCDVSIEKYQHPLWTPRLDGFYRYVEPGPSLHAPAEDDAGTLHPSA